MDGGDEKINKARMLSQTWEPRRVVGWMVDTVMNLVMDRLDIVDTIEEWKDDRRVKDYCEKTMKRKRWQLGRSVKWTVKLCGRFDRQDSIYMGMEGGKCSFTTVNINHVSKVLQEDEMPLREITGEVCQESRSPAVPAEERKQLVGVADQGAGSQEVWPACTVSSTRLKHNMVGTNQLIGKPEYGLACSVFSTVDDYDKVGTDQLVGSLGTRAACTELGTGVQDTLADTEDSLQVTPVGDQSEGLVMCLTRLEVEDSLSDTLADMSLSGNYEKNTRMDTDQDLQDPLDIVVGMMSSMSLLANKTWKEYDQIIEDVEMRECGEEVLIGENSIPVDIPVEFKWQQAQKDSFSGNMKTTSNLQDFPYPGEHSSVQVEGYLTAGKFRMDR